MKIIEKLNEFIEEEICDAEKYAKCYLKHKDSDRELSDLFHRLSEDELSHMERLHNIVVQKIDTYRREHGEPPAEMLAVYDYLHEKQIDKVSKIKLMLQG